MKDVYLSKEGVLYENKNTPAINGTGQFVQRLTFQKNLFAKTASTPVFAFHVDNIFEDGLTIDNAIKFYGNSNSIKGDISTYLEQIVEVLNNIPDINLKFQATTPGDKNNQSAPIGGFLINNTTYIDGEKEATLDNLLYERNNIIIQTLINDYGISSDRLSIEEPMYNAPPGTFSTIITGKIMK